MAVKFTLGNWRNFYSFSPWGGADGTNQWDVNDTGGNNGVFFTGSAVSNSSGTTVTSFGKSELDILIVGGDTSDDQQHLQF